MQKKPFQRFDLLNLVCVVLMFLLLVLQFLPFWHSESEGITMSIQGFMWNCDIHEAMKDELGLHTIVDFAMPFSEFFLCIVGIVFCIIFLKGGRVAFIPAINGIIGIYGYLNNSVYRMNSMWVLHLVVCIAMLVVGALNFVLAIISKRQQKKK